MFSGTPGTTVFTVSSMVPMLALGKPNLAKPILRPGQPLIMRWGLVQDHLVDGLHDVHNRPLVDNPVPTFAYVCYIGVAFPLLQVLVRARVAYADDDLRQVEPGSTEFIMATMVPLSAIPANSLLASGPAALRIGHVHGLDSGIAPAAMLASSRVHLGSFAPGPVSLTPDDCRAPREGERHEFSRHAADRHAGRREAPRGRCSACDRTRSGPAWARPSSPGTWT
ncbi:hypothetical protein DL771_009402 [Monosporascus sp. 5C6A]|nr:hypothetical protein DL771_009402 [Monosporascus sp. 5C6A]